MTPPPVLPPEYIDVMIDMLDDPERRWYVATELQWACYRGELSEDQSQRLVEVLGFDEVQKQTLCLSLGALSMDPPEAPGWMPYDNNPEPVPYWVVFEYVFESLEAAEDYAKFRVWLGDKVVGRRSRG